MMVLQQQVTLLDKFVIQQESIPHLMTATATNNSFIKPNQQNMMKINEHLEQFPKNVCSKKTTNIVAKKKYYEFYSFQTPLSISNVAINEKSSERSKSVNSISSKLNKSITDASSSSDGANVLDVTDESVSKIHHNIIGQSVNNLTLHTGGIVSKSPNDLIQPKQESNGCVIM